MSATAIRLLDGPLEGRVHMIQIDGTPPDQIAVTDANDPFRVYWYRVQGSVAYFDASEYVPETSPFRAGQNNRF